MIKRTILFLLTLHLLGLPLFAGPLPPRHSINLNANEFSVMVNAARYGLKRYGGGAEYRVIMVNQQGKLAWKITVYNTALLLAWTRWMQEYNQQLIQSVDTNKVTAMQQLSLDTAKSVLVLLDQAHKNPIWNNKRITGRLKREENKFLLQAEDGAYGLTGEKAKGLAEYLGSVLVVHGKHKKDFELEINDFVLRRFNALEMFVMSYCPYARGAELEVLKKLDAMPKDFKPTLDVRYIFYKQQKDGRTEYTAMHGEKEIEENLVQMVIRDQFLPYFHTYLKLRAESDDPWPELARKAGVPGPAVSGIRTVIESERETLIEQEYTYITENYKILDGSPRYVWEGMQAGKLQDIPLFKDVKVKPSSCSKGE